MDVLHGVVYGDGGVHGSPPTITGGGGGGGAHGAQGGHPAALETTG